MSAQFVHLSCHTEYSMIDGLVRIKPWVKTVAAANMPACAMTDHCNLFGLVKFYRAAQAAGVKPIVGAELWIDNGDAPPSRVILLCQSNIGYRNLCRLISLAYMKGQINDVPFLKKAWFADNTEDLIVLSGAKDGDIGQALLAEHPEHAAELLIEWKNLFPNRFYLELQRTGRVGEEEYLHAAVDLAYQTQTPVVATNAVCFLTAEDFEAHEVRVAIHDGYTLNDKRRPQNHTSQQYLRSPAEMVALFEDIPEAIENTVLIAQRCNMELRLGEYFLPDFPVPVGKSVDEFFIEEAQRGLEERLQFLFDTSSPDFAEIRKEYDERLAFELKVIIQMGFPGYFLIVADFIQWAKNQDIPVGPGRGSGAGSLVAYAYKITDLDPLEYDLLFERFLNPERVSMPDFDVDFCMDRRDEVIDYVAQKYGRESVSQIITYGSMAAKAVVRDVGRVLSHPYGFVDRIAKLIPFEIGMTLSKALEESEELKQRYEEEEEVTALISMALKLEGITRNAGKHAGGVVIAPTLLTDFAPLYCEADGSGLVTQFDKGDVEDVGLVKFDFLGLRNLTIIKWALDTINSFSESQLDILSIPLDDAPTFELLKEAKTTAVFQLESRGMKDLIKRLRPDCFEDIIALVALFRPGPLQSGMVDDFINRKHGIADVEYPHPDLEPALKPTYGIILYQEQVMQISQVLAGYTLGEADMLRRAMGKKKPEEMAKQRSIFTEGAVKRGVEEENATYIFDLMEKFAGYGFNKSHSAAYALVAYQTAWLKAHYPAAFMAAVMSADMDNTEKVVSLVEECRAMDIHVIPPNVNASQYKFTVSDDQNKSIHYGIGAIKGVGEAAIENIIAERAATGKYRDLFDFCRRVDLRKANRRVLDALIKAGAMDEFETEANRAVLVASLTKALKTAEQYGKDHAVGQNDLFGLGGGDSVAEEKNDYVSNIPQWSELERLQAEKATLGLYLTGHPINTYAKEIKKLTPHTICHLQPSRNTVTVVGWVVDLRQINSRRGKMVVVTLEDAKGHIDMVAYNELYTQAQSILVKDTLIVVEGEVRHDEYSGRDSIQASKIFDIATARQHYKAKLKIVLNQQMMPAEAGHQLIQILANHREGQCPVWLDYRRDDAQVKVRLGQTWSIHPTDEVLQQLKQFAGHDNIELIY